MAMWISLIRPLVSVVVATSLACAIELRTLPEFFRPDPFGGIVESDRQGSIWGKAVQLRAAAGGYASTHLVVDSKSPSLYEVDLQFPFPVDVFREWYHLNAADKKYYPDALVPVRLPYKAQMPHADNRISGQTTQAFWLDIWVPADAKPGLYRGQASVTSGGDKKVIPVELSVLPMKVPEDDVVTMDSNSYGTSWMFEQFPKTLSRTDDNALFSLIHAYHQVFYEHRSTFHQLGYGHGGKVGPEFAPELEGSGSSKHIANWDRFDRHYGPLLDGSAFRNTRRGARPIPFVYLPVNPEWPASYLWWGEPGYEREFVNVLSAMERHFREKNWTSTRFELFFNHKKRYKGFEWDGDEIRFSRDNDYLVAYKRMLDKSLPAGTPVKFVFRLDTTWSMAEQFARLRGVINFWVGGEGLLSWYPGAVKELKSRKDIIWTYGGTPGVNQVAASISVNPLKSWISGVDGFVRWQTVAPGPDPWFALGGGGETLVYPGDRFGSAEPLASIRLKLQRNCLQDLALLEERARQGSREQVQSEVVRRFNGTMLSQWYNTAPPLASKPVLEWNNVNIDEALTPFEQQFSKPEPGAWMRVHEYALSTGDGK
jgi:hypothetical protein